jgi:hypothetical protein
VKLHGASAMDLALELCRRLHQLQKDDLCDAVVEICSELGATDAMIESLRPKEETK